MKSDNVVCLAYLMTMMQREKVEQDPAEAQDLRPRCNTGLAGQAARHLGTSALAFLRDTKNFQFSRSLLAVEAVIKDPPSNKTYRRFLVADIASRIFCCHSGEGLSRSTVIRLTFMRYSWNESLMSTAAMRMFGLSQESPSTSAQTQRCGRLRFRCSDICWRLIFLAASLQCAGISEV